VGAQVREVGKGGDVVFKSGRNAESGPWRVSIPAQTVPVGVDRRQGVGDALLVATELGVKHRPGGGNAIRAPLENSESFLRLRSFVIRTALEVDYGQELFAGPT